VARYYFYKMTTDDGGAPCCSGGLLSLAICKPAIRSTAQEGDIVFGFAADSISQRHGLIYVAEVTKRLEHGDYYKQHEYSDRGDCIYEWDGKQYHWRRAKQYHLNEEMLPHDLGAEAGGYARANVLLSSSFRYFGSNPLEIDTGAFPLLLAKLHALKQGHRVNHPEDLRRELTRLRDNAFQESSESVCGRPTHGTPRKCQDQDHPSDQCV